MQMLLDTFYERLNVNNREWPLSTINALRLPYCKQDICRSARVTDIVYCVVRNKD